MIIHNLGGAALRLRRSQDKLFQVMQKLYTIEIALVSCLVTVCDPKNAVVVIYHSVEELVKVTPVSATFLALHFLNCYGKESQL